MNELSNAQRQTKIYDYSDFKAKDRLAIQLRMCRSVGRIQTPNLELAVKWYILSVNLQGPWQQLFLTGSADKHNKKEGEEKKRRRKNQEEQKKRRRRKVLTSKWVRFKSAARELTTLHPKKGPHLQAGLLHDGSHLHEVPFHHKL